MTAKVGLMCSLIGILGCTKQHVETPIQQSQSQPASTNANYSVSVISSEGKKPIDETLGEVQPNKGYYADMDNDGINDFVIFKGDNTLYFSKGLGNNAYQAEVPVVKVKDHVIAYRIDIPPKPRRPYLVYFNATRKGYFQENMGLNSQGRPIFADAEANTVFDF